MLKVDKQKCLTVIKMKLLRINTSDMLLVQVPTEYFDLYPWLKYEYSVKGFNVIIIVLLKVDKQN